VVLVLGSQQIFLPSAGGSGENTAQKASGWVSSSHPVSSRLFTEEDWQGALLVLWSGTNSWILAFYQIVWPQGDLQGLY
jgi:hypothetical protein